MPRRSKVVHGTRERTRSRAALWTLAAGVVLAAVLVSSPTLGSGHEEGTALPRSHDDLSRPASAPDRLGPATTAGATSYWVDLTSKAGSPPTAVAFAGMVWDASSSEYVLYGGEDGSAVESETYGYTIAGGWKNLNPSGDPGGDAEPAMAYDSTDSEIVLFGGCTGLFSCPVSQTYVFSQGTWTQYTTGTQPPADLAAGISDNPAGSDVVMFGGCDDFSITSEACSSSGFVDTTYTFTAAGGWKQVSLSTYPSAREAPFMTYDPTIGGVLLFGGYNGNTELSDTWEFRGGQWIQLNPATNCGLGANGAMFWDQALGAVVAYGGDTNSGTVGTTWEFKGGNWTQLFPSTYPAPRDGVMAASSPTGVPVLWGGETNGSSLQSDTWAFDPLLAPTTVSPNATDVNQPVSFSANVAGGDPPLTLGWSFGDGKSSSVANTSHSYAYPCSCLANFTVTDSLGQTAGTQNSVVISALPSVTAKVNDTTAWVGVPMQFWGNATGGTAPVNITWNFGDGAGGSGAHPWHAYTVPGTKTATVTVVDGIGKTATASVTLTVKAPPGALVVTFTASPIHGTSPLTVWFNSTITGGDGGDVYTWEFGDGASNSSANTSHVYRTPGSFAVNLTVADRGGQQGANSSTISVVAPPLALTLAATPPSGHAPLTVVLSASPSGGVGPYTYNWTFGDGPDYSHAAAPTHVFNDSGTQEVNYTVDLTILDHQDPAASLSRLLNISVLPTPPITAVLSFWQDPPVNFTANYFVSASGGLPNATGYDYYWNFGDSTLQHFDPSVNTTTHEYVAPGSYHLSVTVVDSLGHNVTVHGTVNVGASGGKPSTGGQGVLLFSGPDWYAYLLIPAVVAAFLAGAVYMSIEGHRRRNLGSQGPPPHPSTYAEPSYYPSNGWR